MCGENKTDDTNDLFKDHFNSMFEKSGLTKKAFAKKCEIAQSSLKYYLNGRLPNSGELIKICKKLNISADWLLGISRIRSLSTDLRAAVMYTGQPENMIERIRVSYTRRQLEALTILIEDEMFPYLLDDFALYLKLLEKVSDIFENTEAESIRVSDDKTVIMNYSTAKDLMASRVSDDLAEICSHMDQKKFLELTDSLSIDLDDTTERDF